MTTKTEAKKANVDWKAVELATEISRTYFIELNNGGIIFKMYKQSSMKPNPKWKSVKMVGIKA